MVNYHVGFINGYGFVNYFYWLLTYEEECHVIYFDTLKLLNDYVATYENRS